MKRHLSTILVILIFLLGVGLVAYPSFSNWWNDRHQSRAIATYQEAVDDNDDTTNEDMLAAADAYNEQLLTDRQNGDLFMGNLTDEQVEEYNSLLDITGTGIMGYVRIPKIDVELPIYHGTDEAVLQIAVGHIEGSSLPVGGKGTHAVISGHRGLPSAKLFTDIDSLGIGDIFIITCLNRKITYEVDQILTVLPNEVDSLEIDPEQDYCTLVTCTPYGVNSHRLLVRGHRIDNLVEEDVETIQVEIPERELSTQEQIQQWLPYVLILAAGFFGLALLIPSRKRTQEEIEDEEWHRRAADRDRRRRTGRYGESQRSYRDRDEYDDRYDDREDPYDRYRDDRYDDRYDDDPYDRNRYRDDRYDDDRYDDRPRYDDARRGARSRRGAEEDRYTRRSSDPYEPYRREAQRRERYDLRESYDAIDDTEFYDDDEI